MDSLSWTVFLIILSISKGEIGKCHCKGGDSKFKTSTYHCGNIQGSILPKTKGCDQMIFKITVINSNIENVTKETFRNLNVSNVITLELVSCNIHYLHNETLSGFPMLQSLTLSKNRLTEGVISWIYHVELHTLQLDGNSLFSIDAKTFHPRLQKTLQRLDLHECNIEYIGYNTFENFLMLKFLRLSENNLNNTSFLRNCHESRKYNLRTLNIAYNFVEDTSLFSQMSNNTCNCLSKIRTLIIDGNPLRFKEGQTFSSETLITLSLRNCTKETPFPALNLPALSTLYLKGSYLFRRIKVDAFLNIRNLRHLDLSGLNLSGLSPTYLQKLFKPLQSIRILHLTNASIKENIGKTFHSLTTLEKLYLDFNEITTISDAFSSLPNLRTLHARNNNISVIKIQDLPAQTQLKFDFSGNPFHCTCAIADFRIYCGKHFKQVISNTWKNYVCKGPKEYARKSFWTFRPRYSDCHGFNPYIISAIVICVVLVVLVFVLSFLSSNKHRIQRFLIFRKVRSGYTQISGGSSAQVS